MSRVPKKINKSKVQLIIMPSFESKQPHLGIACLSAYLKQRGIDLTFTDFRLLYNCNQPFSYIGYTSTNYVPEAPDLPLMLAIIKNYNKGRKLIHGIDEVLIDYVQDRHLKYFSLKDNIESIYKVMEHNIDKFTKSDIIGFTTYETNFFYTIMLSLLIRQKNPDAFIIYGGPHVSQHWNAAKIALKSTAADKIVIGEGENALVEIVHSRNRKEDLLIQDVMSYDKKNNTFKYRAGKPVDLNHLPRPDFSIFKTSKHPFFALPLYSSRGCIFRCSFCNEWKQFYPFRQLGYIKLIENMKYLHQRYNTIQFDFADSLLNSSLDWLDRFADELLRQNLDLQWGGFFRGEMQENLLKKLKTSGLSFAFIGIESFSDCILVNMEKKRNAADNLKTVELFCSLNISTTVGIIVGFPSSNESDFKYAWKTLIKLTKKYPDSLRIHAEPFQLRPMSKIHNNPESYGISLVKWNAKVVLMVPEFSDIVNKIPMAISGAPKATDTIRRLSLMNSTFANIPYSTFSTEGNKKFNKRLLGYIKPSYKIRIPSNYFQISSIQSKSQSKSNIFLLSWNNTKYPITSEECFMLDHFNGRLTLLDVSKKLSLYFGRQEKICYQTVIKLLNDLVDQGFQFDILF